MLELAVDIQQRLQVDVGEAVACACVKFGNGQVAAQQAGLRQREAVDEGLALLPVAVGGKCLQRLGNILEIGAPVAVVGHVAHEVGALAVVHVKLIVAVCLYEIGIYLLAHRLVGYAEFNAASLSLVLDGEHTEIVEQGYEVVGIGDGLRGERVLQFGGDAASLDYLLDDGGVVLEARVLADEHPQPRVVHADVRVEHLVGESAIMVTVAEQEV